MNYVILAGGSGTRLWPMSRSSKPKQLTQLVSDLTMIEDSVRRLEGIASNNQIFISTNDTFAPMIKELLPNIPNDQYIIEPEKRDTGPAMAFVAAWMSINHPDEPMILMPSDHFIRDQQNFQSVLNGIEKIINDTGVMVNIGIQPTFPNTHLGYLEVGGEISEYDGLRVYEFKRQVEKPDYEQAKQFLERGNFLWNGGYFAWTPAKFVGAYCRYAPSIGKCLEPLQAAIKQKKVEKIQQLYGEMEKISIDYAVIEKMEPNGVLTVRGYFGWADLGSWDMLYDQLGHLVDESGNLIKADWHGIDTRNTLVYAPKNKIITTVGISDMVIVDTPDALLVTPISRAQDVKKIVELLKKRNLYQHL